MQNRERNAGWKKKKVSLVFGYVGKDYRGLQMIDPAIHTIERELEGALFSLGCILPTNRQNLEKIGWSRSSRTDKGSVGGKLGRHVLKCEGRGMGTSAQCHSMLVQLVLHGCCLLITVMDVIPLPTYCDHHQHLIDTSPAIPSLRSALHIHCFCYVTAAIDVPCCAVSGVHAARIVVSAKLLLAPEWLHPAPSPAHSDSMRDTVMDMEEEAQRFPALVEQLNRVLPPAVRAFSCTRVNKGFQAREACHWR